jgi:hypothetical protein
MPDFSNAKVGDRVYSLLHGWGTIKEIRDPPTTTLFVLFDTPHLYRAFSQWGGQLEDLESCSADPILYWDKPEISDPPPPKKKVKKVGYAIVYKENGRYVTGNIYEDSIPDYVDVSDTACGIARVEYEVEE